jgi:hypothetical protein
MITAQNRARFEKMGPSFVRLDIAVGEFITTRGDQEQAFEWLNEKDLAARRREGFRYWFMIALTAVAAVAACIAAWPIIKGSS